MDIKGVPIDLIAIVALVAAVLLFIAGMKKQEFL